MHISQIDLPQVKIPISFGDLGIVVNAALESCRSRLGGCFNANTTLRVTERLFQSIVFHILKELIG